MITGNKKVMMELAALALAAPSTPTEFTIHPRPDYGEGLKVKSGGTYGTYYPREVQLTKKQRKGKAKSKRAKKARQQNRRRNK